MIPLNFADQGKKFKIVKITACLSVSRQLKNMGLLENEVITVIHNTQQGPLIIAKDNLRFALGRGMSFRVYVQEQTKGTK